MSSRAYLILHLVAIALGAAVLWWIVFRIGRRKPSRTASRPLRLRAISRSWRCGSSVRAPRQEGNAGFSQGLLRQCHDGGPGEAGLGSACSISGFISRRIVEPRRL